VWGGDEVGGANGDGTGTKEWVANAYRVCF
jgi:hypothetical protein